MDTKQEDENIFSFIVFYSTFRQKVIVSNQDNEDHLSCLSHWLYHLQQARVNKSLVVM